jgi:hypothetical protein
MNKKRERPHPAHRVAQQTYGPVLGIARSIRNPGDVPSWDQPLALSAESRAELNTICARYTHDRVESPKIWERQPPVLRLYAG